MRVPWRSRGNPFVPIIQEWNHRDSDPLLSRKKLKQKPLLELDTKDPIGPCLNTCWFSDKQRQQIFPTLQVETFSIIHNACRIKYRPPPPATRSLCCPSSGAAGR